MHRKILREVLKDLKIPVYIWCDIDGDGLEIARQIYDWINSYGCIGKIVLMSIDELIMSNSNRKATEHDLKLIEKRNLVELFPDVTEYISRTGITLEQERLLSFYDYVEGKLP